MLLLTERSIRARVVRPYLVDAYILNLDLEERKTKLGIIQLLLANIFIIIKYHTREGIPWRSSG